MSELTNFGRLKKFCVKNGFQMKLSYEQDTKFHIIDLIPNIDCYFVIDGDQCSLHGYPGYDDEESAEYWIRDYNGRELEIHDPKTGNLLKTLTIDV